MGFAGGMETAEIQVRASLSDESTMNFYNEMMDANGGVRAHYQRYDDWLKSTPPERIARKRAEADLAFHRVGITFAVYGEEAGKERLIPFDIVPAHHSLG